MKNKCPKCGGVFVGGHYCSGGWEIGKGYSYLSANVFSLDEGKKKMTRDEILNMPAGEEMDKLVIQKVMKTHPNGFFGGETVYNDPHNEHQLIYLPKYSTDIAAAWQIAEKLCLSNGCDVVKVCRRDPSFGGDWSCNFGGYCEAFADTAALAICRAALLTLVSSRSAKIHTEDE